MTQKNLSIIGGGLAGYLTLFHLVEKYSRLNDSTIVITLIESELYPSASQLEVALTGLRGIKKGNHPMSDKLMAGQKELKDFIKKYNPSGVSNGFLSILGNPMTSHWEQFKERFGRNIKESPSFDGLYEFREDCSFFSTDLFFNWLKEKIKTYPHFKEVKATVTSVDELENKIILDLSNGEKIESDAVIWANGAYATIYPGPVNDYLRHSSVLSGAYWCFENIDWKNSSFSYSSQDFQDRFLTYSHLNKTLLIGNVNQDGLWMDCQNTDLDRCYEQFNDFLDYRLPPRKNGVKKILYRHKGPRREVFCGKIKNNQWALWGLYKYGYTLGFSESKRLVDIISF